MQKVSAGIIEKDGKILIAHRKTGKCVGQKWEFPGGKVEAGETTEECLKRELKEELNIEVEIIEHFSTGMFECENRDIELIAYRVKYLSGEIRPVDHDEIKWVSPHELTNYEFTLPDVPIAQKILQNF